MTVFSLLTAFYWSSCIGLFYLLSVVVSVEGNLVPNVIPETPEEAERMQV